MKLKLHTRIALIVSGFVVFLGGPWVMAWVEMNIAMRKYQIAIEVNTGVLMVASAFFVAWVWIGTETKR